MENLTSKDYIQKLREICKKACGDNFSEEVFQKALGKAKRWMKAAYGSVDYAEWFGESDGESITFYYQETLDDKSGGKTTFNNQNFNRSRK